MSNLDDGDTRALEKRPVFWFYGSASMAYGIKDNAFSYLLLIFANQVLGIPGYLAAIALALAMLWDSVSDLLLGHWSDKTNSKYGRRHPFMLTAPIPVALSLYMIFSPPMGLSTTELFLWLICFSVLLHLFMTLFFVPHLAFGGEMSKDYHARSTIMSYNNFGSYSGAASAHWFGLTFFFYATAEQANGLLN